MAQKKIDKFVNKTSAIIEGIVGDVETVAKSTQNAILEYLEIELLKLEISQGALVKSQPLHRLLYIENGISALLQQHYNPSIIAYFQEFTTIEQRAITFQKTFSQLEVDIKLLSPLKQMVYDRAMEVLSGAGLHQSYIIPARYLMMQQVVTGASITESQKLLKKWSAGKLNDAEVMGRETPNLQRYSTQIARDTAYQYNGLLQNEIQKEYKIDGIKYVGDVIDNSRPLCRYLVEKGEVALSDLPALLQRYPQGTIRGTNKDNFLTYRGGYSCRHTAYPVKLDK